MNELINKLEEEKFNGKEIEWEKAKWSDVNILFTEDKKNWYYKYKSSIYVQTKRGDHTPHCYKCNSEIKFKEQRQSVWFDDFDGPIGGGEVRIKYIPYCPKCEDEPSNTKIILD